MAGLGPCELARIVPQIAGKMKELFPLSGWMPSLPAEQAGQALTDAVRQFFACVTTQDAPVLLFLDDLHWAGEGTLAMLHALARQARELRLLILSTYRDVELDLQHPLERALEDPASGVVQFNLNAPRMLLEACGDFALETSTVTCELFCDRV